jgi:hypothetical protein
MKEKYMICKTWKEGKGRGFNRYNNCHTCHFAGYGVCLYPYPDQRDALNNTEESRSAEQ